MQAKPHHIFFASSIIVLSNPIFNDFQFTCWLFLLFLCIGFFCMDYYEEGVKTNGFTVDRKEVRKNDL